MSSYSAHERAFLEVVHYPIGRLQISRAYTQLGRASWSKQGRDAQAEGMPKIWAACHIPASLTIRQSKLQIGGLGIRLAHHIVTLDIHECIIRSFLEEKGTAEQSINTRVRLQHPWFCWLWWGIRERL